MKNNTFTTIHNNYLSRCSNPPEQKSSWQKLASEHPPVFKTYTNDRVSLRLTRESGDMGIALIWIIQTAIIRPFFEEFDIYSNRVFTDHFGDIKARSTFTGALAHSEEKSSPVILANNSLTGKKKYITGGKNSDLVLLTAKTEDNEKPDSLILIPCSHFTEKELVSINTTALLTTDHAGLHLDHHVINKENLIDTDGRRLRKKLLTSSLVERTLMTEAVMGMILYLTERIENYTKDISTDGITEALENQKISTARIIESALSKEKITPDFSSVPVILKRLDEIDAFNKEYSDRIEEELQLRIKDLLFFKQLLPGR